MLIGEGEHAEPDLRLASALAAIHAVAFAGEGRAWSAPEILAMLNEPVVALRLAHHELAEAGGELAPVGFALYRTVTDEAELLTVSVRPEVRRAGLGAGLLAACDAGARAEGAIGMYLEVAEGNAAARALYARAGFREVGQRKDYYRRPDGSRYDALVLAKAL
jgi:ribosomal-protein-alanine N-acetyltransferase